MHVELLLSSRRAKLPTVLSDPQVDCFFRFFSTEPASGEFRRRKTKTKTIPAVSHNPLKQQDQETLTFELGVFFFNF